MNKYVRFRSKSAGFSFLVDRKALAATCILAMLTLALLVASAGIGTMRLSPLEVLKVLIGMGEETNATVVLEFRLPRILTAMLVGAELAAAGAIMQGIIRNPLASPDIVGVTGGASVAAVAFITMFETASVVWLPPFALIGALAVTLLIYVLAWKSGVTSMRLVLIGVGIGAAMSALTTLCVVMAPVNLTGKAVIWLTGTVYGANWKDVLALLCWMLVFMPLALVYGRAVNAHQLGDDVAFGIGDPVQRNRFILLFICAALAGSAVALGGAIGFVALIAPHIARKLVGPAIGGLLPASAFIGALMVMFADLVGRTAFAPLDVPAGVFTAAVGAPFFIYLLYKHRNQ
jgi:iron complex transport system permease protein